VWLKMLQRAVVTSATHEAGQEYQRPGCHEGTRLAVLQRLLDWLLGNIDPHATFLWLYGDAGAGKSSIGQTFAVNCAQQRRLLASFFFWRDDPRRSTHTTLMATLLDQSITVVPALRPLVAAALERDPSILQKHLGLQIKSLLVEPINDLLSTDGFDGSSIPGLILIDGLDECSGANHQCSILNALVEALPRCRHTIRVLVASRPELEIKAAFNANPLLHIASRVALDASFKPDADIRKFLVHTFEQIRYNHPIGAFIPVTWPSSAVITTLVNRSSGQFIFASTIGKYVADPARRPTEQLEIILAVRPAPTDANMPYTELNALYTHVLSRVPSHKIEMALDILLYVTIIRPQLLLQLENLSSMPIDDDWPDLRPGQFPTGCNDLTKLLFLSPSDLVFYLAELSSLVGVHVGIGEGLDVGIAHASLGDFLLDPHRSKGFYRDSPTFISKVLCNYINHQSFSRNGVYFNQMHLYAIRLTRS